MTRPQFSSRLTAILCIAGAAIGLGNVWRFPYMMSSYGGSAFLLIYLMFVILIAIPAVMSEWSLGRHTRGGSITAFSKTIGPKAGRAIGYTLVGGILISASYYIVVIGNIAFTTLFSLKHGFSADTLPLFQSQLSDGPYQSFYALLVLAAILLVCYSGVNKGIERVSTLFVPFFFLIILYLIYSTFQLEGASDKAIEYLKPDFSAIDFSTLFAALGQAVFSLGLGGTVMLVYGSYLPDDSPLLPSALSAALADTGAALLAALFIFPTMLVFAIDPESGPRLLFHTLPNLFGQMAGGRILGSAFLVALLLVAFLSGVAALEVIIASISDDKSALKLGRQRSILVFGVVEAIFVAAVAMNPDWIAILDLIFGTGMLAAGCAASVIALAWCCQRALVFKQLGLHNDRGRYLYFWLRWVIPCIFLLIFIGYLLNW